MKLQSIFIAASMVMLAACGAKRAEPRLVELQGIKPGISKYSVASIQAKTAKEDLKAFVPSLQTRSVESVKSTKVFKNIKATPGAGVDLLVQLEMVGRDAASMMAHLSSLKSETAIKVLATFTELGSRKNLGQIEIIGTSAKVDDAKLKLAAVDSISKMNDNLDELALASVARQLAEYIALKR